MVSYCCVRRCSNNSNNKKKDPNTVLSFHAFPSNPELKSKWLRAIGRPNWVPPNHSRVCSAHFNFEQINYDGCRIRIKDDEYPINLLPPNSNFEASNVEACRICLATDVKMYSIQRSYIKRCIESVVAFSNFNIEGLPNYVCYQCAPCLVKSYKLFEKSMIAQATLLEIFAKNGEINKTLIKELNRKQLNLKSSLEIYSLTTNYNIKHEDDNISQTININPENDETVCLKNETEDLIESQLQEIKTDLDLKVKECEIENDNFSQLNDDYYADGDEEMITNPVGDLKDEDPNDYISLKALKEKKLNNMNHTKRKAVRKKSNGLTPDETEMLKYFDIVKLSLKEQVKEWRKSTILRIKSETVYKCEICFKAFANFNSYRIHVASHDPSQGCAECPVCKLRFKNIVVAKSHANRAHGKKFYCKSCPKAFNNVGVAKKHQRWHSGYLYRCSWCPFTSVHESSLGVHRRRAHGGAVRVLNSQATQHIVKETAITKSFRCAECSIDFASESAKRLHILTSSQHKTKTENCDPIALDNNKTCKACGKECSSLSELVTHTRAEHPRPKRRTSDIYPTQCELCGETLSSRKKHWQHVRRQHPKDIDTYRPVVSAICDTCGKGFQNSTKLRLHQLRHTVPTIRCAHCPHLFYDKYALARHACTHSTDKPHQCRTCGRAFKLRSNLERHSRCGETLSSRKKHWQHVRRQHPKDIDTYRPVVSAICDTCGKGFQNSTKLRLHQLRHTVPTIRCAHCPRLFYDKYALARHACMHSTDKPHQCRTCGRAFKLRSNLERHSRVHTDIAPYECTMCGKKFKYSSSVNLHVRTVHYKLPHPPRKKRSKAAKHDMLT